MRTIIIYSFSITFFSFILTFLVKIFASKKAIIAIPNSRSSHTIPTPTGGGLAIAITWYSFLIFYYFFDKIDSQLFYSLLSGLIIVIIGFFDDIKNLTPKIRIIAQSISSILGVVILGGIKYLDLGFAIFSVHFLMNIFLVFLSVWMINLFNFLDGIDAYLGSEGFFIFSSLFLITGDFITLAFAFCLFGFLIWNWPRAKIFCGDVGSTLIGYNVIIFAIYFQNTNQLSFIVPIILSGLFWVDATVTLIRRWKNREKLSEAHKKHAYQRLVQAGFKHVHVVLIGLCINLVLLVLVLIIKQRQSLLLLGFLGHFIIVFLFIKYADLKKSFQTVK